MSPKVCLDGRVCAGCLGLVLIILTAPVVAQPSISTFLLNGVAAPDGNGEFSFASGPVLNDTGQLSFLASVTDTSGGSFSADRFGVFRLTGTSLVQVTRGLDVAPDSADQFGATFSSPPPMNFQGKVAFTASRNELGGEAGLYTGTGSSLQVIANRGDSPPDGNGTFHSFAGAAINPLGQVAFVGGLAGTTPANVNSGIYRGDGVSLIEIVRLQDGAPDGNGSFTGFDIPAINSFGQVAFAADLSAAGAAKGVFRGMESSLIQIARDGMPAPGLGGGTNGQFNGIEEDVALNNLGQVAFGSSLSGTSGTTSDNFGLFRGASEFSTVLIARKGQAPTEGNGVFSSFSAPAINNFGSVAFRASFIGNSGGGVDNDGIYVGNGSSVTTILRGGTLAPNGDGTFELFNSKPVINDAGQVAFEASFQNATEGTGNGLYFWDPTTKLMEVARVGDPFLGSTITQLRWAQHSGAGDLEHSGLNGAAKVAFSFRLEDNTEGLAIWSANLNVVPTGDYDGDGDVDGNDFLQWQRGQSPNSLSLVDLTVWQVRYGSNVLISNAIEMSSQSIPEPKSLMLLAIAGLLASFCRNNHAIASTKF